MRVTSREQDKEHDKILQFISRECSSKLNAHLLHPVDASDFQHNMEQYAKYVVNPAAIVFETDGELSRGRPPLLIR